MSDCRRQLQVFCVQMGDLPAHFHLIFNFLQVEMKLIKRQEVMSHKLTFLLHHTVNL